MDGFYGFMAQLCLLLLSCRRVVCFRSRMPRLRVNLYGKLVLRTTVPVGSPAFAVPTLSSPTIKTTHLITVISVLN